MKKLMSIMLALAKGDTKSGDAKANKKGSKKKGDAKDAPTK